MKKPMLTGAITREPHGIIGRTFEQTRNEITTHGKVLDVVGDHLFIEWTRYDSSKYCSLCPVADLVSGVTFDEARS
jgi:hypothetical protein